MNASNFIKTCKQFIYSFDLYDCQPMLFYKGEHIQHTTFGLVLSLLIYIGIISIFCYFLFDDNFKLTTSYDKSLILESYIMRNPILIRLYDEETGQPLEDGSYEVSYAYWTSVGIIELVGYKCEEINRLFPEYYSKFDSILNTIDDWKNYFCLPPDTLPISKSSQLSSYSDTGIKVNVIPKGMYKYENKTLILSLHYIFADSDEILKTHTIKYKDIYQEITTKALSVYTLNSYFSNSTCTINGNFFNKYNTSLEFIEYEYSTSSVVERFQPNLFLDEDGNFQTTTFEMVVIKPLLDDRRPIYLKEYTDFSDIIGKIGGWISILLYIISFVCNSIVLRIINFDVVDKFMINVNNTKKGNINLHDSKTMLLNHQKTTANIVKFDKDIHENNPSKNNFFKMKTSNKVKFNDQISSTTIKKQPKDLKYKTKKVNKKYFWHFLLYFLPRSLLKYNYELKNSLDLLYHCFNEYFSYESLFQNKKDLKAIISCYGKNMAVFLTDIISSPVHQDHH